jgi:membrane protein YdbS with pleckstrin-like domain
MSVLQVFKAYRETLVNCRKALEGIDIVILLFYALQITFIKFYRSREYSNASPHVCVKLFCCIWYFYIVRRC